MIHIYIRGMSESARDIRRDLKGPAEKIVEHICKLALFPEVQECDHWRKEIYKFLFSVSKQDPKNKFPTSKFIFDSTFGVWGDTIESHMRLVTRNYIEYTPRGITVYNVEQLVSEYFRWLSVELSKWGSIDRLSVIDKLRSLGL